MQLEEQELEDSEFIKSVHEIQRRNRILWYIILFLCFSISLQIWMIFFR